MIWFQNKLTSEMLENTRHQIQCGLYSEFAETVEHYIFDALVSGVRLKEIRKVKEYVKNTCECRIYPVVREVLSNISESGNLNHLDNYLDLLQFCCKYTERDANGMIIDYSRSTIESALEKAIERSKEGKKDRVLPLMFAKNYAEMHPERVNKKEIYDKISKIERDYPSAYLGDDGFFHGPRGRFGPRGPL